MSTAAIAVGIDRSFSIPVNSSVSVHTEDLLKDLPPLTDLDYLDRQQKACQWMERLGIDALLVEGGVNMSYFMNMGWWSSERLFCFLLSPYSDPVWISPAFEKKRAEELIRYGSEIMTWEEHESPYKLINSYLDKIGKPTGKLGIGPNVRQFVSAGVRRDSRAVVVDGSPVTEQVRSVKTDKEIRYMDVANYITKRAYQKAFQQLESGMSRSQLGNLIRQAHSQMGVSGSGGPLFGEQAAFPHGTQSNRTLQEGDVILVDGGCSVNGYRSDVTRTVVFGKPSDRIRKVWDVVYKAQQEAFKIIRSGTVCEEADRVAREVVQKAGFGKDYENFTHRLGHGIGREGHEFPYLVRGNKLNMRPGMTFTNEPGIYLYGEFGIRIEDSFVVTESGYKNLGGLPAKAIDIPFSEDDG